MQISLSTAIVLIALTGALLGKNFKPFRRQYQVPDPANPIMGTVTNDSTFYGWPLDAVSIPSPQNPKELGTTDVQYAYLFMDLLFALDFLFVVGAILEPSIRFSKVLWLALGIPTLLIFFVLGIPVLIWLIKWLRNFSIPI